jgi:hypothetical protein
MWLYKIISVAATSIGMMFFAAYSIVRGRQQDHTEGGQYVGIVLNCSDTKIMRNLKKCMIELPSFWLL